MAKSWSAASRKKLSAIRDPAQGIPKGFYFFDRASVVAALDCSVPYPERLTVASETERAKWLASYRGISWRETSGRNFTAEYTNALVGLWVDSEGFDFALDMILPELSEPEDAPLGVTDTLSYWAALRRYLFAAPQAEYDRLYARVAPLIEARMAHEDHRQRKLRDHLAFTFSRDSEAADRLLRGDLEGTVNLACRECILGASTDAELVGAVIKKSTHPWYMNTYHVFDIVESIGGAAADILPLLNERQRAPDRKRILAAVKIAEKLRAQG